ncbi:trypco2 family protein [Actinomadura terrae]|uniref:trypco2 family protein n=1 Tax=Actinomadura terrae TaxID=604353 RepID=UPI001FA7DE0C|nr:trypco2 family protein [Actinomadura terrae]
MQEIGLAEAVKAIRDDLVRAEREGADADIRFTVGPIEVAFDVALTREAGANGKVKVWVVEAGASGKVSQTSTHRVAFTLTPTRDGRPVEVGDLLSTPSR